MKRIVLGGLTLLLVLLALGAWQLGLFTPEPEEVNLADAVAAELDATTTTVADSTPDETTAAPTTVAETTTTAAAAPEAPCAIGSHDPPGDVAPITTTAELDGTWIVRKSDATFAGYRIDEILSGVDFTAVGRSSIVTGSLTASAGTIESTSIAVDMVGLTSDSRIRDEQMKGQALETRLFPVACFTLTEPIAIAELPAAGGQLRIDAVGDLHIHGVTNPVTVPLDVTTAEGLLFVVGSADAALADYMIDTPSAPAVAGVSETATFEFSLVFSPE